MSTVAPAAFTQRPAPTRDEATDAAGRRQPSAPRPRGPSLGQQLLSANLVTEEELEAALECQKRTGQRLGEILISLGFVSEDQLLPFLHRQLGLPAVRLREGLVDPKVVRLLPRPVSERLRALAMFKVRDVLTVAMAEPQNLLQVDEIEEHTGLKVRAVFASRSSIERMTPRCYEADFAVDAVTADLDMSAVEIETEAVEADVQHIAAQSSGSPVINLVNYLILQALRQGVSDIHIEPSPKYSIVRFRVDGMLREVLRPRRDVHPAMISRIKVMGKMDIAEQRMPQDGRCRVAVEGREVDLRISTLPTVLGEKVVLRVLDRSRLTFDLHKLGLPNDLLGQLKQLLAKPHGLLLVSGPTGSGKTTTLYSALELIKSVHRNIVTVEDPVEYRVEQVNQTQVNESISLDFPATLRSILRQDPDVIMVGEIRDSETAQVAVRAALTGHLVLSTIHTNDSVGAVVRLVDMGVDAYKVAAAVVGVVSQRLIRTVCTKCQSAYYPPAELLETLHYQGARERQFVRGEGCRECYDTGFHGRTGIYELFWVDEPARRLISEHASPDNLRQLHRDRGGRVLLDEAIRVAEQQRTSLDEVMRVAFIE